MENKKDVYVTREVGKQLAHLLIQNHIQGKPYQRKKQLRAEQAKLQQLRNALAEMQRANPNVNQQNAEVERLRAQLTEQLQNNAQLNAQIQAARQMNNQAPQQQYDNAQAAQGMIEILLVMGGIQNVNIKLKLSKFSDEHTMNPLEFLEDLDQFFRLRDTTDEKKISLLQVALEGRAKLRYGLQTPFQNYNTFREAFENEFYSIPIQVQKKNEWAIGRFSITDGSLQIYFYKKLKSASYIRPALIVYERNYMII